MPKQAKGHVPNQGTGKKAVARKAVKPVAPPAHDAPAANAAWLAKVRKDDGSTFAVFASGGYAKQQRWLLGTSEYDGKGLLDAVKTNADQLNAVKKDVDTLAQAVIDLRKDVQALKEAPAARPFP